MILPEETISQDEPSASDAAERIIEAGQRLVVDRIELARLELQETMGRTLRGVGLVVAGATLGFAGWLTLMAVTVLLLRDQFSLATSLTIVGALHAIGGGAIILFGMVGMRRSEASGSGASGG